MTLLAMILPGIFALYLEAGEKLEEERVETAKEAEENKYPTLTEYVLR